MKLNANRIDNSWPRAPIKSIEWLVDGMTDWLTNFLQLFSLRYQHNAIQCDAIQCKWWKPYFLIEQILLFLIGISGFQIKYKPECKTIGSDDDRRQATLWKKVSRVDSNNTGAVKLVAWSFAYFLKENHASWINFPVNSCHLNLWAERRPERK